MSAQEAGTLAQYIQLALKQNPEIRAAHSKLQESTEKNRRTGTLPDPVLGAQYFIEPIETRTGPQEASISLSQSVPWPTRLSLDKKVQQYDTEILHNQLQTTRLAVIRRIKEAYVEYGYLGLAKNISAQTLELMRYLENIAQTNYTNGKSSYSDILKLQREIDKLQNQQISLEDQATPARVRINGLLGMDRNLARTQPTHLTLVTLSRDEEQIHALSRKHSPIVMAGQNTIEKNKTSLDIADDGFYPNFNLSLKTIFTGKAEFGDPPDSGQDPVIAGLNITLPINYDRRNGAVAEKRAGVQKARNKLEQTMKNLEVQIELALFQYREADRQLQLYQNKLIPKINQELEVELESFQNGQESIQELINIEKERFGFELARVRAQADMAILVARLEELAGTTLADWNENT